MGKIPCPPGPPGPQGPQGPPGAQGPAGSQGPAGIAASTDYGYIYQSTAQIVPVGEAVSFDSNGTLFGGIAHVLGDSAITINVTGHYKVMFSVTGEQSNQFALFVNDALIEGSLYGSASPNQQNNGVVIVSIVEPSTLKLRNHISDGSVTLETLAGGIEANVTASILIQKL
jgi:hypothetical protein